ncbi:hypothetical protein [Lentibacillus cibarius]|uniref:Uncharacterized protein n=1 Tax=Lentibacillus cibarius TaxID=2583219 RepID=A0A5S3QJK1_9BACI|nr:hypothetical protein [Lentibacillus cibarius]TMN18724.1 hypothetical protein FFL34_18085 [Lentibacillus cibarius]
MCEENDERCHEKCLAFRQNHPEFFQQPIIQSFLQDETHYKLVKRAICSPTQQNMKQVNEAFQTFYKHVKNADVFIECHSL